MQDLSSTTQITGVLILTDLTGNRESAGPDRGIGSVAPKLFEDLLLAPLGAKLY